MTEDEWLSTADFTRLVRFVEPKGSARLWRLLATASTRRLLIGHTRDKRSWESIRVAERYADGECSQTALRLAQHLAEAVAEEFRLAAYEDEVRAEFKWDDRYAQLVEAANRADAARFCAQPDHVVSPTGRYLGPDQLGFTDYLRDIFGNPFRPVSLDRSWLTTTVVRLAQTVYDDRQLPSGLFDNQRLAILADALEDAGCDSAELLTHLRGGGEHVRGCWAVDLLLGKD